MTPEKWREIIDTVNNKFPDATRSTEELDGVSGGSKEVIEFSGPIGNIRLEFVSKPRFLGEDAVYSNRIGSDVKIVAKYDENDLVHYMKAYKESDDGSWEEINADSFV